MRKRLFGLLPFILGSFLFVAFWNDGSLFSTLEFYLYSSSSPYIDELVAKSADETIQSWHSLPPSTHHRQASILLIVAQQLLESGDVQKAFSSLEAAASLCPDHERLREIARRLLQVPAILKADPDSYECYLSFALMSSPGLEAGIMHDATDYYIHALSTGMSAPKLAPLLHRIDGHDASCAAVLSANNVPEAFHSCGSYRRTADAPHTSFMAGCTLGLFAKDDSFNYNTIVDEIVQLHSNWIALAFIWEMGSFESTLVDAHGGDSIRWETLIAVTRYARLRGLKVFWFPVVNVKSLDYKHWRGNIVPRDEYEWFLNYTSLLNVTASLAESEAVDGLSIGSELNSLQRNAAEWNRCLASVRLRFHGLVTYSANWDSYQHVSFAGSIDMLGITGYFPLSRKFFPAEDELLETWAKHRDELIEWSRDSRVPIYFSEMGYPSLSSAAMQPWNYCAASGVDLDAQKHCFESVYLTWHEKDALHGVFFYEFYNRGGIHDGSYSPRGKPAEKIIERWFFARLGNGGRG